MLRVIATLAIASMAAAEWTNMARAPKDMAMGVTIALNRVNLDFAAKDLEQVSDPDHPRYTDYRSLDELTAYTRPSEATFQRVLSHIDSHNVVYSVNARTGLVLLQSTVADVEAIFSTAVYSKFNAETNQVAVRADDLTVPAEIAADVEAVFGVTGLPLPPRGAKIVDAPEYAQVTPDVIASAYKISGVTPSGDDKNRQAIAEFQGQLLSQSDLTTFFQKFLPSDSGDDQVYAYKGDKQQGDGVEANLDIQYIMGVAPGVKTEAWQYAGMDFCADLKQWTQEIIADSNGPNVHSVSYGWQGPLDQIGCSTSQVASIDQDFMTISASGVSIIFASGDSGSGYTAGKLYSSWPASSQYVTSVGATGFVSGSSGEEQASTQFGSGGGFSRVNTPAPEWQSSAISTFDSEETKLPPASVYGKGGRGTPDVAALGEGFQVVINGNVESVGGTSASAPTFAGIVSLLNEARIQAGKKSLGLLNKFLYKNAGAAFNDITVGSNRISRGGTTVPYGFDCVEGWDPVSGWGTVDFPKLLKAAMNEA